VTNPTTPETEPQPPRAEFQFSLQAFLWMFVVVAVFLSYIRTFNPAAVAKFGLVATLALLVGGVIGLLAAVRVSLPSPASGEGPGVRADRGGTRKLFLDTRFMGRFSAAVFWAGIGVVGGYLAVVHTFLYHWTQEYAWPLMGGVVGATAAVCGDANLKRRIGCSALVWLVLVMIYDLSFFGLKRDLLADPLCAFIAGALFGLGVDLAARFEEWTSIPRHFFALALVILAIAGHWLAIRMIPGV
jgi:hypothetical protein